jgi:hypoxanthine phosphoribosyltransferase
MKYEVFEDGFTGEMHHKEAREVLLMPDEESRRKIYVEIAQEAKPATRRLLNEAKVDNSERLIESALERLTNSTEISLLMEGTLNLVNTILEHSSDGDPIRTMIFLDKSARNGAFLFNTLWNELDENGEIPLGIEKPEIRFMNIGRFSDNKHEADPSLALLQLSFTRTNFEKGKVLVVDEMVSSGGSVRRALKTIEDVFEVSPIGIAQFASLPNWYGGDLLGIKGITDEEYDGTLLDAFADLRKLPTETILELKDLVDRYSEDFQSLYEKVYDEPDPDISERDVSIILSVINQCEHLDEDGYMAIQEFIRSAGGFLGRPLAEQHQHQNSIVYRRTLRFIVESYMAHKNKVVNTTTSYRESISELV